MIRAAAFLRGVPVLSGLSEELLERLATQVRELKVRAGDWIFREGELAESMFIVNSGRLEVIDEGPPEAMIRVLRRGDVLGELALLRQGTRSASVRARRDAELLELGRAEFESLIEEAPSFALGLTRAMGAQLAASRSPVVVATPPRTIAVVGLDRGAAAEEAAERLADGLEAHGSVGRLSGGDLATIDQAERNADRVILRGGDADWTELALREADLVVALTTGVPDAEWLARDRALRGCELIVLGPAVTDAVIDRLQPRELQVIANPAGQAAAIALTARRLAGRARGIVLSGGGARALAHLGVLDELRACGLSFDRVAGVSLGSLVAAGVASGFSFEVMYEMFERGFADTKPTSDFAPPAYSLLRGARTRRLLHEVFGERRIEALPLRFFCLSCDLAARESVLHTRGPVADSVYASLAIPGIFPPVATDGRLLVDGAVLDNLPVATMARAGEGPVLAVDVTGRMGAFRGAQRPALARLGRPLRRILTGSDAEIPRLGETIVRTVTVGSSDTVSAARLHADLVVSPRVDQIGLLDWKSLPRAVELGRQAVREAFAADPTLFDRLGR
jgi:predicted acylesterase/phospholipase RssA/CRP-like cAMP-binding protein